jgi:hypothetical protein
MIQNNMYYEWCDDAFMLSSILHQYKIKYNKSFPKTRKQQYDGFLLWFAGYLYKYWIDYKDVKPKDLPKILEILPWDMYMTGFAFYHTQDWKFVIDDAIRIHKLNKRKLKKEDDTQWKL